MYSDNFLKAFLNLLTYEGIETTNHKLDKGGKTSIGITEYLARIYGFKGDIRDLTLDEAKEIYYQAFWIKMSLDNIPDYKTAFEIFEFAVNCGDTTAVKGLQRALNYLNRNSKSWAELNVDGIMGSKTLSVVAIALEKDKIPLLKCVNGEQYKKYTRIIEINPTQEIFIRSWLRRVTF